MVFPINRVADDWTPDQLFDCLAQAQLYVLRIHATERWMEDPNELPELGRQHLLWLWELERSGALFASGPLDVADAVDPFGMIVIAAPSKADAERIAASEPFHLSGWRRNTVRGWTVNEGVAASTALLLHQLAAGGEIDRASSVAEYLERLPASHGG